MVKQLFLGFCLSIVSVNLWAAVSAQVDTKVIAESDVLTLVLSTDQQNTQPDLSVLQADFEVVGQSQQTHMSVVNGQVTHKLSWRLSLYPLRVGELTIPAILVGQEQTNPITITVQPQSAASQSATSQARPDIKVEIEALPSEAYVQQQVLVKQRLLLGEGDYQLSQRPTLEAPHIEKGKGTLSEVGKPRRFNITRNGKRYRVIERLLVLSARESGNIVLSRTRFEGVVTKKQATHDFFAFAGKTERRITRPLTVKIKPQPPTYKGKYWLPAKQLSLSAHWDKPVDQLKAGEPVTLTIATIAEGLLAEQLPALEIPAPVGMKVYSDQPELKDDGRKEGTVGIRQDKWVFIATGSGEFELPEIKLDWWNVKTQQVEVATLEAVTLKASGEVAAQKEEPVELGSEDKALSEKEVIKNESSEFSYWFWGLALLLLGLLSVLYANRCYLARLWSFSEVNHSKVAKAKLKQSCVENNAKQAYEALSLWAKGGLGLSSPFLVELKKESPFDLLREIEILEAYLYHQGALEKWEGDKLWLAVQSFEKSYQVPVKKRSELQPLYPSSKAQPL